MEEKTDTYRKFTFPKTERLHSKKLIDALFLKGASFYLYPFSIRFMLADSTVDTHQFMVSVSKRNFKRAVDRNRIKRLVREAYRLHKHDLQDLSVQGNHLLIAYIYTAKEIHTYNFIEKKLIGSFKRLKSKLIKDND